MSASVGLNFHLSEEQRMLRGLARDFARSAIAPEAEHYDRTGDFPWPILEKAREAGLLNLNIPVEYGGPGASLVDECLVGEELAWGCSGIATSLMINDLAAIPVLVAGTEAQKREWLGRLVGGRLAAYAVTALSAGSDVAGLQATAARHGDTYVLKGSKTFISNASVADYYVVFAYTDRSRSHNGLSAFVVERTRPGLSVSRKFDKLGQRASDTAEITLDEVEVPESHRLGREGDGFMIAMRVFDRSRPAVAVSAVGVARRALEESVKYAIYEGTSQIQRNVIARELARG